MNLLTRLSATAALLLSPLAAFAASGYIVDDVSLRAGPDTDFPRITVLDEGTPVRVLGCIDGWEWCDVVAYGERGWVAGRFVELDYGGRHVVLDDYGPRIGVPIISFSFGNYWGSHYRNRSFYSDRTRYSNLWSGTSDHHYSSRSDYRPSYQSGYSSDGQRSYDNRYDNRYDNSSNSTRSYSGTTYSPQPSYRTQNRTYDRQYAQQAQQQAQQQVVIQQQQQATIREQARVNRQVQTQQVQQQQAQIQQQAVLRQQTQNLQESERHPGRGHGQGRKKQLAHEDRGLHRGHYKEKKHQE